MRGDPAHRADPAPPEKGGSGRHRQSARVQRGQAARLLPEEKLMGNGAVMQRQKHYRVNEKV
jgi:hypothetical protein